MGEQGREETRVCDQTYTVKVSPVEVSQNHTNQTGADISDQDKGKDCGQDHQKVSHTNTSHSIDSDHEQSTDQAKQKNERGIRIQHNNHSILLE